MIRARVVSVLRRRDDRGTATAFVVGMAITLLAVAGLVVDGGNALNARMKLADDTEQAARAGAQQIDELALRENDVVQLDQAAAQQAASGFIARFGYNNAGVNVTADEVTVGASDRVNTVLLSLVGVRSFEVNAVATAEAVTQ
ncbi:hypothetical protein K8W59_12555 [Nocardioides rotundus]|uniref:TadE/TadG family type IV pilus assembly protein n=1 Tax=Nocardioides rotundus TaxID=1774216 RepID=UPI001CBA8DD1|nr:pilus assembly protein TadG-related protein [Nocardioides rotundus]UAL28691.1 hypothetical protein K8W59_12555 [Nocardioides rotundus]